MKVWVCAEVADGKVSGATLEMLTKAREIADPVEAVYAGPDADAVAASVAIAAAATWPGRPSPGSITNNFVAPYSPTAVATASASVPA